MILGFRSYLASPQATNCRFCEAGELPRRCGGLRITNSECAGYDTRTAIRFADSIRGGALSWGSARASLHPRLQTAASAKLGNSPRRCGGRCRTDIEYAGGDRAMPSAAVGLNSSRDLTRGSARTSHIESAKRMAGAGKDPQPRARPCPDASFEYYGQRT